MLPVSSVVVTSISSTRWYNMAIYTRLLIFQLNYQCRPQTTLNPVAEDLEIPLPSPQNKEIAPGGTNIRLAPCPG